MRWLLAGLAVLVVGGAVAGYLLTRPERFEVRAGGRIPETEQVNRKDESGAATLRAYLEAQLACGATPEANALADDLGGYDRETAINSVFRRVCDETKTVEAELVEEGDDPVWALEGGELPDDFAIALKRQDGRWIIRRPCSAKDGCTPD